MMISRTGAVVVWTAMDVLVARSHQKQECRLETQGQGEKFHPGQAQGETKGNSAVWQS